MCNCLGDVLDKALIRKKNISYGTVRKVLSPPPRTTKKNFFVQYGGRTLRTGPQLIVFCFYLRLPLVPGCIVIAAETLCCKILGRAIQPKY